MKNPLFHVAPLTLAIATLSLACGDDGPAGTGETGDAETMGDGDGETMGDGDGDGDPGDGDGDPGDGDGDTHIDTDMDGVFDDADNCVAVPNPNQLDFDDNGIGNVCDVQVFTNVSGTINTNANADAGAGGSCSIPIQLTVTSGEVQIQLDDDAAVAAFDVVSLGFEDILDQECSLNFGAKAYVSIKDFSIDNVGDAFPVSMPHGQGPHDAGSIAGDSDAPHPILATGTLEASTDPEAEPEPSDLNLEGTLGIFTANITGAGAMGTLAWATPDHVVAMDTFMITEPFPLDINFELVGLVGSLVLAP
ncbi:hypothetical protein ENSA5_00500 [Enhygromyxa salina]|uniref:Uncharacterized protein n=1 Tax=Enhygromyxa salina TaxID=215803 RepID=A0A2S9YL91_9BACT|nr:hypothetical protein [Enhygromyxa salina]PRQ05881.1 hypothetical protein ENSA5_00500 [Enhygromyxa salina]